MAERTRRARSPAMRLASPVRKAPTSAKERLNCWNSRYSATDRELRGPARGQVHQLRGVRVGERPSRTPLTIEKMAVFAPIPRASVSSATAVKAGLRRSDRTASRMSYQTESSHIVRTSRTASRVCVTPPNRARPPVSPRWRTCRARIPRDLLFEVKLQLVVGFSVDLAAASEPAHVSGQPSEHLQHSRRYVPWLIGH